MIAVDIMGGDFYPDVPLKAALSAARQNIPVLLLGPKGLLVAKLNDLDKSWASYPIQFSNATEILKMEDEPVKAVLKKKNSSLVKAVRSVKDGEALGVVSAGNSGALMAAATFILKCEDGIDRPAIMGFLPARKDKVLCLDLGANLDCKPKYLEQFAHLGSKYLSKFHNINKPRIGLLSNGSEDSKGSYLVKDAHKRLKKTNLNFIGNIEPSDIFNNNVDVVVCDGFVGNILLKTLEGMVRLTTGLLKDVLSDEEYKKLSDTIIKKTLGTSFGGAQLLGVNGTVIVAHGASDEIAMENAIKFAWKVSKESTSIESAAIKDKAYSV